MKKHLIFIALFVFVASFAFAQHVSGDDGKTYYDAAKTKLKEVYNYKQVNVFSATGDHTIVDVQKKKHGPYFYYYESGKIKISGSFKDDKKNGSWKYFNESGNMVKTESYVSGKLVKPEQPTK